MQLRAMYIIGLLLFAFIAVGNSKIVDLGGQWILIGVELEHTFFNITVPGGVYSDLMDQGYINDIFFDNGDTEYRWVSYVEYVYLKKFTVDEALLAYPKILLVCEGIDTFATIDINNVNLGSTQNMFVRYTFDLKSYLTLGDNQLSLRFFSPEHIANDLALNSSGLLPPECPESQLNGICHINRIRKMQASFGWDLAPGFPSFGIYKDIYLLAYNNAIINYIIAIPSRDTKTGNWTLAVSVYLNSEVGLNHQEYVELELETEENSRLVTGLNSSNDGRIWFTEIILTANEVKTWWPNGYGSQPLYKLEARLVNTVETFTKTVQVGFRTAELIQEELETGSSFYFKVNNVAIFAKGTNKIPLSILSEKTQDPVELEELMQLVKESNMNMLRVWGGGVYESDYFYDLADQYGIMIWQDFMFADAMYPVDLSYLNNVADEVRHQVSRLLHHPSIVAWCGNSENEESLRDNWFGTDGNFSQFQQNYISLYVDTIESELSKVVPNGQFNFLTSTPSNGILSEKEDYVSKTPNSFLSGTMHFFDYSSNAWDVATYPIPRFVSEYGFQSSPSLESWSTATDFVENLYILSNFMDDRQHLVDGNLKMLGLIDQQLQLPQNTSKSYPAALVYFSQILQAQAVKIETEHYRSFKGRFDDSGSGNTMGALYWMLKDVWVAPTWSGIDFIGRWKMLQYFVKDFFNPLIITGRLTSTNNLEIYVILDALEVPPENLRALVRIYSWDNFSSLVSVEFPLILDTSKAVLVTELDVPQALSIAGCGTLYDAAKTKCFFRLHIVNDNNEDVSPINYVFPEKLKESQLPNATVQIVSVAATNDANTEFKVEVSSNSIALFVWLDSHDIRGTFSENGFLLVESGKTVIFTADEVTDADALTMILTVTHLRDPLYW